jgi:membrane associated rhomboid family serine protease
MTKRPTVTYALILINALAYLWEAYVGMDPAHRNIFGFVTAIGTGPNVDNAGLNALGALDGTLVLMQCQWWRIITGAFLHANLAHIGLNMFALLQLGSYLELAIGSWRMFAIYAVSLFGGGLAVVYFSQHDVTLGASGAIYGHFGALIAIGLRLGQRGRALIGQMVPILAINLVFTFAVPVISKAGHVGGLISGFLAGLVFFAMRPREPVPVVVDRATGESTEAELLEPETPRA